MHDIVQLHNIDKVYGDAVKTQVLFDVNLSLKAQSFNSIIGQSGSGKSTLLNLIGTLDRPTSGDVIIDGQRTSTLSSNALSKLRNETIGFIFQFHYLLPEFTALENVLMPHYIKCGKIDHSIEERAVELLDLVGLSQVRNSLASKMSGGQQQRTAIARALINRPKLILADEPTGNLDSNSSETVYQLLRDINTRYDTTFLIITHDRRIAEKTDRIIEIKDGRVAHDFEK